MTPRATQSDAERAAEQAVIALGLLQPGRIQDVDLEPWHFFDARWERAWAAMQALSLDGQPVDEVTVAAHLATTGGAWTNAVADLGVVACGPVAVLPERYVEIIRSSWVTRKVLAALGEVITARGEGADGEELLSMALQRLADISVGQPGKALSIGELVRERYRQLVELAEAKAKGQVGVTGVPTGIESLDAIIGGLQRGICTVAAGRPGTGKSALGMTVTANASRLGLGVHVFSLEDTRTAYTDRAVSRESGVPAESIRTCGLGRGDLGAIEKASQSLLERSGWLVDDRSGISAEELVRSVRRELRRNATQVVVVDYVQLIVAPPGFDRPGDKTRVVNHAMDVLADAAKQDNLAYLALAQLNRDCEKRDNKRPILADLKQSGTIEERSKAVLMLYRPFMYREKDPETGCPFPEDHLEILIRKNNHGRMGKAIATWHGPTTRIS